MNAPLVPDSYDISLGDDAVLHVMTRADATGERPHVRLTLSYLEAPVSDEIVYFAVHEIAATLEAYAATLRRMAPNLPSHACVKPE